MLLLKIQSLSYGHSIQLQTVERLIAFIIMIFSCNLWTRFTRASGDLAPLAHLSLLLGEGEVYFEGKKSAFECCFKTIWLATDCFTIKRRMALDGTQFMSAYGAIF
jgi:histidine ammonia-lyase